MTSGWVDPGEKGDDRLTAGRTGAAALSTDASRPRRADATRNRQALLAAATVCLHRDGNNVPMAVIAAEAGVGVGTLYRNFATRDDLLGTLTHRSMAQVQQNLQDAELAGGTAPSIFKGFIESAIRQRNDLVLPLHGGPPVQWPAVAQIQREVNQRVADIIERGREEGSIRRTVEVTEVIALGAMLARPHQPDPAWDDTCRHILHTFLAGLSVPPGSTDATDL